MIKKLSSLVVAVALILSLSVVGYAAPSISSIEEGVFVNSLEYKEDAYQPGAVVSYVDGDYAPGAKIPIYLNPEKFVGTDLDFTPENGMSIRDLERAGVGIRTSGGKNSNLIKSTSFKEQQLNGKPVAYIEVELIGTYTEVDTREFETVITLLLNKQRTQTVTVGGTIANTSDYIESGDSYVDLSDGSVVEAMDNIQDVEVYTGNNVTLFTRMFKGKQYYAVSNLNPVNADLELMEKYPEIQMTVTLETRGFSGTHPEVKIDLGENFYAYAEDGTYLGRTSERLAFSDKYYLATEKIEIKDSDTSSSTGDGSSSDASAPTTEPADDGTPPGTDSGGNVNVGGGDSDIPNTGINTGLKVAVGVGIVSVLALIILLLTRKSGEEEE